MQSQTDIGGADEGVGGEAMRAAYEAYAQSDYYLEAWRPMLDGTPGRRRLNWAAMIFGMTWCFYRKMYVVGLLVPAAFFVAVVVVWFIAAAMSVQLDPDSRAQVFLVSLVAILAIRVPFGFLANRLYFRKATREIEALAASGLRNGPWLDRLRSRGGTSTVGVLIALGIGVLLRIVGA